MKLTKDQRYTVYCIMLEEAKRRFFIKDDGYVFHYGGLCNIINHNFNCNDKGINPYSSDFLDITNLPELYKYRPIMGVGYYRQYWFAPYLMEPRIQLLKKVILEMEKKWNKK